MITSVVRATDAKNKVSYVLLTNFCLSRLEKLTCVSQCVRNMSQISIIKYELDRTSITKENHKPHLFAIPFSCLESFSRNEYHKGLNCCFPPANVIPDAIPLFSQLVKSANNAEFRHEIQIKTISRALTSTATYNNSYLEMYLKNEIKYLLRGVSKNPSEQLSKIK